MYEVRGTKYDFDTAGWADIFFNRNLAEMRGDLISAAADRSTILE